MSLITKYIKLLKRFRLSYRNGFFILPYFGNSPQELLAGFDYMPFVDHNRAKQLIDVKSMFLSALFGYRQIEEGLWITYGKVEYKKNISYERIIDSDLPSDYHFLSLEISRGFYKKNSSLVNGYVYSDSSWLLFKPNTSNVHSHLAGVQQESITLWFSDKFLRERLLNLQEFKENVLSDFFNSDRRMIMWKANPKFAEKSSKIARDFFESMDLNLQVDQNAISTFAFDILKTFTRNYASVAKSANSISVNIDISKKIMMANRLLMEQLTTEFMGVEWLAQQVGMSPTYFKTNYKIVYGQSPYQQLKTQRLLLAEQLLKTSNSNIKEIAEKVGYQNAAKFTKAFKDSLGYLPSEGR